MGSRNFQAIDRNMRRIAWMNLIEQEWQATRRNRFRASLVDNPLLSDERLAQDLPKVDWSLSRHSLWPM